MDRLRNQYTTEKERRCAELENAYQRRVRQAEEKTANTERQCDVLAEARRDAEKRHAEHVKRFEDIVEKLGIEIRDTQQQRTLAEAGLEDKQRQVDQALYDAVNLMMRYTEAPVVDRPLQHASVLPEAARLGLPTAELQRLRAVSPVSIAEQVTNVAGTVNQRDIPRVLPGWSHLQPRESLNYNVEPDRFDGVQRSWLEYKQYFEVLAEVKGWSRLEKAQVLALSLDRHAQSVVWHVNGWHEGL